MKRQASVLGASLVRGLTLVEVLAAMVFVAIVVPVTLRAIMTAKSAGVEADREREAARIADRLLNEFVVTGDWAQGNETGEIEADEISTGDGQVWRWRLTSAAWNQEALDLISVEVFYEVQGRERSVQVSTVVEEEATSS